MKITLRLTLQEHARLLDEAGTRDISTHARHRLFSNNPPIDLVKVDDYRQRLMILDCGFDLLVQLEEHLSRGGRVDDDMVFVALQQTHDRLDEARLALVAAILQP